MSKKTLTPQQEKFCLAVAEGMGASEAYRRTYKAERMKDSTVSECASRLMADRKIAARLGVLRSQIAEKSVLKAADVLQETRRLLLLNPARIIKRSKGPDGKERATVLMPDELDADTAAAVASFEIDDMGRIKYKFWDKNSAADRAARMLGLYEKDNRQKAGDVIEALRALVLADGGSVLKPAASASDPDDD
jgi:phage terminase small subunit